ncbi:MAG: dienelactone hydrolase family protein, partial [Chloroflexota bacterium]
MDILLNVNGKLVTANLALPASGKGPGVLVLHAWWGLNPFFKSLCAQLAEQGFVVLAPDLNNGEVVQQVAEAEALMERRDYQFIDEIVLAAKDFLLSHPACASQKLGIV